MHAVYSLGMSVNFYQIAEHHIPKDSILKQGFYLMYISQTTYKVQESISYADILENICIYVSAGVEK
jgi:hypothetical protein